MSANLNDTKSSPTMTRNSVGKWNGGGVSAGRGENRNKTSGSAFGANAGYDKASTTFAKESSRRPEFGGFRKGLL